MKTWLVGWLVLGLVTWLGCTEVDVLTGVEPEGIRVIGTGKATATPDIARVRVGVETFDRNVQKAVVENNRRTTAVIAALKARGIDEKDIQTVAFSVSPRRDYRREPPYPITGFTVRNVVAVTIREIENVGMFLQAAIDAEANSIDSVTFDLENPESFRAEARTKALEDAKARADTLAEAAGVRVGKPIRIVELSAGIPSPLRVGHAEDAAAEVPVEPGEIAISVTVEVLFEIES